MHDSKRPKQCVCIHEIGDKKQAYIFYATLKNWQVLEVYLYPFRPPLSTCTRFTFNW